MGTYISIDKIPKITCSHVFNICVLCTWTHVLAYDIISLYSGEGASIICRPTGTHRRKGVHLMSDEKKSTYTGYTEARKKANEKYLKESVEDIRIRVPKGDKAKVQEHAATMGESMNSFVVRAIQETMMRDNQNGE